MKSDPDLIICICLHPWYPEGKNQKNRSTWWPKECYYHEDEKTIEEESNVVQIYAFVW